MKYWKQLQLKIKNNLATSWTASSRRFNSLFINYRDYFNYRFLSTVIDPSIVGLCVVLGLCGAVLLLISNLYVIIWWLACVATIMWLFNKLTGSPQDQGKSPRPNPQTLQTQREAKIRVVSNGRECSNGNVIVEDRLNQSYDYGNSGRQGEEINHGQLNNNTDKDDRHQSSSVANGLTTVDEEMPDGYRNVVSDRSMSSLSPTEWSAVTSPGYSSRIVRAAEHDPPLREMRTPGGRTYNLSPFQRSPNRNLGIGDLPSSSIGLWKSTVAPSPARFSSPQSANRSLSMGYHRREENPGRLFLKIAPLVDKSSPVTPGSGSSEIPENTSVHSGTGTLGLGGTRASPITNKFSRLWPNTGTKNSLEGSPSLPMTTSTPISSTLADNLNRKRMRMSEDKPETDSVSSTPSSTPAEETSSNKRLKFISTPGSSSGGGDAHGHILSNPSLASVPLTNYHNTGTGMSSESILEQMNQTEKRFLPDDDSSTTSLRPAVKRQKSNSTSGSSTTPTRLLQTPSISPAFIRKRKVLETHPPSRTPFTVVDEDSAVTKEKTPRLCGCADCYKEAAGIPLTKPETTTKPTPVVAEVPKPVTENVPSRSTSSGGNTVTAEKKSEDVLDRQPRTEEDEPKKTETLFPYSIFDKEKHMADKIRKEARLRRILELSQENSRSSNLSQPQASSSSSSASSSVSVESTAPILSQPPVIAVTTAPTTSISFSTPSSTTLAVPNTLQSTTASASATTLTTPPTSSASTAQFGFTPSISNQQSTIPAATLPTTQTQPAATSSSVPSFGFSSPLAQPATKKQETESADSPSLLQTSSPSTSTPQTPFKFGAPSTSASVSAASGLAASTSTPTFGVASSAPAVAPPTVGFNFGTPAPSSGSSTSSTASTVFSFGGSSSDTASPVVKENTPSIFPAQQSTSSTAIGPAPSSTAASQPQPSLPALTPLTTPAAITFGTISTPTTSKSDTALALPQPKTASTGQFGFPAPSTTNQLSTPSLSFPAASKPALPSTQTQSVATPAAAPAFGFNSSSTVTGGASTNNSGAGTTAFPSLQSQPPSTTPQVPAVFQFGSPVSSTSASTNSSAFGTGTTASFGGNSTAPAPSFSFGSSTSATTAPQSFGSTTTPAFGSTVPAFGSTTTAPAFGAPNTGFNFGAQSQTTSSAAAAGSTTAVTNNTSGFGGGMQQSQSNFGGVMQQTQSQSSPFGTNVNTTTTTPAGFNFTSTQPTTVSTASGFGTSVPAFGSTTPAPAFGSTTTPAFGSTTTPAFGSTTAPTFGGATTAPTFGAQNTGGFNFGAQASTTTGQTAATSLTSASTFGTGTSSPAPAFGSNSTTAGTGSTFGFTSTPTTFASTTSQPFGSSTPAFGSTVPAFGTTSPTPAFGAPSPSTGFNFGSPAPVTSATTGPTFGGSFGAPQPQATTGFNFGSQATSTPPAFGASNQQAPSAPFQFGATANVPQGSPGFAAQQPQMFTVGGSSPSTRRPMGRGRRYR